MKALIIIFFVLLSNMAIAGIVQTVSTKVNNIEPYANYGGGDVTFKVDNPAGGCIAYWLSPNDRGFNSSLSVLLSALHAQSTVRIQAFDDQLWSGTTAKYCKVYIIGLQR